jgi:3-oxoacyl-[acyl-carrier-protein] synthase III
MAQDPSELLWRNRRHDVPSDLQSPHIGHIFLHGRHLIRSRLLGFAAWLSPFTFTFAGRDTDGEDMPEAVIVSVARTPIGKAYRGALNNTHGPTLGAHAVAAAVQRAGVDGSEVDDVIVGGSLAEGTTGMNVVRHVALRTGLPVTVPGVTVNRFCSTGLQTIATAAQQIRSGQNRIVVAGGLRVGGPTTA